MSSDKGKRHCDARPACRLITAIHAVENCITLPDVADGWIDYLKRKAAGYTSSIYTTGIYMHEFNILTELDRNTAVRLAARFPKTQWISRLEAAGTKAENNCIALISLNPELYGTQCVSFMQEEANYFAISGDLSRSAAASEPRETTGERHTRRGTGV